MATDAREDKLAESGFTAPELTLDAAVSAFATDG
jgi:hypothetical protein